MGVGVSDGTGVGVGVGRSTRFLKKPGFGVTGVDISPDIYKHEWASFTTKDFPENRVPKTGDRVRCVMTDVEDRRPVVDVIWYDAGYLDVYEQAGLKS
jgi:hypothetical protein